MKIIKILGVVAAAVVVSSCSSSQVATKQTTVHQGSTSSEDQLTKAIHLEVNRYRSGKGLQPLKFHKGLAKIAKPHSNYMRENAGTFSVDGKKKLITHYGFDARKILANRKYRIESLSENVIASHDMGQGTDLAAKMVRGWLTSPNHRHNLDSKWSQTGIAVSYDNQGRAFVTQLFGSNPSQMLQVGGPMNAW
jgi:uncharacterized protein YkwD